MAMPMPPPPQQLGGGGAPAAPAQPSYGGTSELMSQPSGQDQMSDPKVIISSVFKKIMDIIEVTNQSFPGGEDKISEGLQTIGVGFTEKINRMGTPEAPGPPIAG